VKKTSIGGGVSTQPIGFVAQEVRPQRARQDPRTSSAHPGGYGFSQRIVSGYYGDPAARKSVVLSEQFVQPPAMTL
jgi:hypothetical protein